jgi:hypothetical protein
MHCAAGIDGNRLRAPNSRNRTVLHILYVVLDELIWKIFKRFCGTRID